MPPCEAHYPAKDCGEGLIDPASVWAMCGAWGDVCALLCSPVPWHTDTWASGTITCTNAYTCLLCTCMLIDNQSSNHGRPYCHSIGRKEGRGGIVDTNHIHFFFFFD